MQIVRRTSRRRRKNERQLLKKTGISEGINDIVSFSRTASRHQQLVVVGLVPRRTRTRYLLIWHELVLRDPALACCSFARRSSLLFYQLLPSTCCYIGRLRLTYDLDDDGGADLRRRAASRRRCERRKSRAAAKGGRNAGCLWGRTISTWVRLLMIWRRGRGVLVRVWIHLKETADLKMIVLFWQKKNTKMSSSFWFCRMFQRSAGGSLARTLLTTLFEAIS